MEGPVRDLRADIAGQRCVADEKKKLPFMQPARALAEEKGEIVSIITITNRGPDIAATDYWDSPANERGILHLSTNAGAFRLLIPRGLEDHLNEMATAKRVVITRGPWRDPPHPEAVELLFDDESDSPFVVHLGADQCATLPPASEHGRECVFTAWTAPRRNGPRKALERPAVFRIAERVPTIGGVS